MGGQGKAPVAPDSAPGRGGRFDQGTGTPNTARDATRSHKRGGQFTDYPEGGDPFQPVVKGRDAWALQCLMEAGANGCTPITEPAPRWSAYVHKLRKAGVAIETLHEPHGGAFAGTHGRYVLACKVVKGGGDE